MNNKAGIDQRIDAVGRFFATRRELDEITPDSCRSLLRYELGNEYALDGPVRVNDHFQQAIAPQSIYHICAGNLAISASTSLLLGLLLGSRLIFKLPAAGIPEFSSLVSALPHSLGCHVTLLHEHDEDTMLAAEAVVAFGNDETIANIHRRLHWRQRFLPYGHKISLGWINAADTNEKSAQAACHEIITHEQSGCLSPQAYLCHDQETADRFASLLVTALRNHPAAKPPDTALPWLREARLRAMARGDRIHLPSTDDFSWTVVRTCSLQALPGPGHRFIHVIATSEPAQFLSPLRGSLSAVSASPSTPAHLLAAFASLGISRVCSLGQLQNPPLTWLHDGRPRIADLLHWVQWEKDLQPVKN